MEKPSYYLYINYRPLFAECLPRNISWNFAGFAIMELLENHTRVLFVSACNFVITFDIDVSQAYRVLSSAKLHKAVSDKNKNKSFIKILNNNGPKIDPCGTPKITSKNSLNVEKILTLCFLCVKYENINFKLLLPKP